MSQGLSREGEILNMPALLRVLASEDSSSAQAGIDQNSGSTPPYQCCITGGISRSLLRMQMSGDKALGTVQLYTGICPAVECGPKKY